MEIIVALLMITILALFFAGGLETHASVATEADILKAHLRYAQAVAMANNTAAWRISILSDSYSIERNPGGGWETSPLHLPGENSATHQMPAGVTLASSPDGTIMFNQWGAPDNAYHIALSDGERVHTVAVVRLTGLVP